MRLSPNPEYTPTRPTKAELHACLISELSIAINMLNTDDPETPVFLEQLEDTLKAYLRTPSDVSP